MLYAMIAKDAPGALQKRLDTRPVHLDHLNSLGKKLVFAGALLNAEDVPNSPMYDTSEALEDPQAKHLQLTASAMHPVMGSFRTVRSPVSFDGVRSLEVRPPPTLDEHGEEIRRELAAKRNARTGASA